MGNKNIRAVMIIEIAGRPATHVKEALEAHIGKMDALKDVMIVYMKISEPTLIDEEKEIYSCFAEVEIEVETLFRLSELIFDYMPSSIEVLSPDSVSLNVQESSMFLNDLAGRLHKYDEIAKIAQLRNKQLFNAYQQLQAQIAQKAIKEPKKVKKTSKKKVAKKKKE